jgi:hypothetical protein
MELPNSAVVRASSVVLVMAAELGVQGFLLLVHRIVPVLFAPFPDCLQPSTKPFGNRLHVHCELPLSATGAYVHKAQEIEGCRFLSLLPRVLSCISPEFQPAASSPLTNSACRILTMQRIPRHGNVTTTRKSYIKVREPHLVVGRAKLEAEIRRAERVQ